MRQRILVRIENIREKVCAIVSLWLIRIKGQAVRTTGHCDTQLEGCLRSGVRRVLQRSGGGGREERKRDASMGMSGDHPTDTNKVPDHRSTRSASFKPDPTMPVPTPLFPVNTGCEAFDKGQETAEGY